MRSSSTVLRGALAATLCALLVACNGQEGLRRLLQTHLDWLWTDPARKAETEAMAETKLKAALESQLRGKEFEVTGPNPYLHHIKSVNVDLGQRGPVIAIPAAPTMVETSSNVYVNFPWEATWSRGNGAKIDVGLDLRTHTILTAYEYPDHTVRVRNIDAWARGSAAVVVPRSGATPTATITLGASTIDLTAEAEGWFWSVDVSGVIKQQVNDKVLRELVGKAIRTAVSATP